jgi:hypothetical protein
VSHPTYPNIPIFLCDFGSAAFTALYAVIPAQNNGAAYSDFMLSGIFVAKSSDTVMYSAYPPLSDSPVIIDDSQSCSFPSLQY